MFNVSALGNIGYKIRRLLVQKRNHFASLVC